VGKSQRLCRGSFNSQVIVTVDVTRQANDKQQPVPMPEQIEENLGEIPERVPADPGYLSEENVESVAGGFMKPFIPRDPSKRSDPPEPTPRGRVPHDMSLVHRMLRKLKTKEGKATDSRRKERVEPVFGQIKQVRGIRAFLLRGLEKVKGEWK
jgi:hypothetical protein